MSEILFYNDRKTQLRTPYLSDALAKNLRDSDLKINSANRHEFESAILQNPDAIFIAENIGSKCHHMRDISPPAIKAMKQYAYNGGTLVFFGGGSHYAMKEIIWHWDNGTVVYKGPTETFAFVAGKMIGPHHRFPLSSDSPIEHNGCFQIPLLVHRQGTPIQIEQCWQGNCGNFIVDEDRIQHGYEILATYAQAGKTDGIAALDVPIGNKGGNIILCSTMPHYNDRTKSALWDSILTRIEDKISRNPAQAVLRQNL